MSTATIYATALHKQKDQYGCYGISILKDKARKPKDSVGQFYSVNKTASQLGTLIYAVSLVQSQGDVEEIHVISDLGIIEKIYNGTIDDWERNDWRKPNKQAVPQADLWKEIFDLMQTCDLTFSPAPTNDTKMANTIKLCKSESRKKKNLKILMKDTNVEAQIAGQVTTEDLEKAEVKESKTATKSVAAKGKRGTTAKKEEATVAETKKVVEKAEKPAKPKAKSGRGKQKIIATVEPVVASEASQVALAMQETQASQAALAMQETQASQAALAMQETQASQVALAMQETQASQAALEMQETQASQAALAMQETQASQAALAMQETQAGVEAGKLQFDSVAASNRESMLSEDSIVLDSALKANCESLFAEIGLDLDTAVNLFLKHSLRKKGLTLDLKLDE